MATVAREGYQTASIGGSLSRGTANTTLKGKSVATEENIMGEMSPVITGEMMEVVVVVATVGGTGVPPPGGV